MSQWRCVITITDWADIVADSRQEAELKAHEIAARNYQGEGHIQTLATYTRRDTK